MDRSTTAHFSRLRNKRYFRALVSVDITLITLFFLAYVLVNRGVIAAIPDSLQLARERSLPETLSYAKWILGAALLGWCWFKTRQSYYRALALLLTLMAADDALLVHETYGKVVAEKLGLSSAFAMDPKEIGEVIVFGLMGAFAFLLLALAYLQADLPGKVLTMAMLFVILGLGVVGVLFDANHHMSAEVQAARLRRLLGLGLTIAEDGGEMIFASVMLSLSIMQMRDLSLQPATQTTPERLKR